MPRAKLRVDITGQKFGYWKVLEYLGKACWLCRCEYEDCGSIVKVYRGNLKSGKTTRCKLHRNGKNNSFYNHRHSKETKEKIGKSRSGKCMGKDNPNHGGLSEEHKKNLKENHVGMSGKKQSEKTKEKLKILNKGKNNPMFGKKCPEHSKQLKKLWQTPEYVQNQMKARGIKPNKLELKFNKLLQQFLPGEYKYVGDGEFILAGKCPDFVNVNGQKKIIELFGDYWHKGQTGKNRINLFQQYGYQTLIIWEKELENKELLRDRILQFNNI
jgi:G:T-mismatch repair DNA endonuclease (very short patch repair protein)